jgi:hypothetical protein
MAGPYNSMNSYPLTTSDHHSDIGQGDYYSEEIASSLTWEHEVRTAAALHLYDPFFILELTLPSCRSHARRLSPNHRPSHKPSQNRQSVTPLTGLLMTNLSKRCPKSFGFSEICFLAQLLPRTPIFLYPRRWKLA